MNGTPKWIICCLVFFLMANGLFYIAFADDDHHQNNHRHQNKGRRHADHGSKNNLNMVNNSSYKENCGACHFAYQPELLPSGSWDKILSGIENHYGHSIELDPESKKVISEYLRLNASNVSSTKLAIKIMKDIGRQTPLRITEIAYIQKKHHGIRQNILEQKSVGSLSNCSACHSTAENGIFDDDTIKIPN